MWDLPVSVRADNLGSVLGVARTELGLTRHLIRELMQSGADRQQSLMHFVPQAEEHDRDMVTAGQRVRVIKRDPATGRGSCSSAPSSWPAAIGTVAGPLGASPGASTAVSAMLTLLERCFPVPGVASGAAEAIPSYGRSLSEEPTLLAEVRASTMQTLELNG
jgi:malate dehydrogenase (quinone)